QRQLTAFSHRNPVLDQERTRLQSWKGNRNWRRRSIMEQMLPDRLTSLTGTIRIFQLENGSLLRIWRHLTQMEAAMHFTEQIVPEKHWQWSFTIMRLVSRRFRM